MIFLSIEKGLGSRIVMNPIANSVRQSCDFLVVVALVLV